MGKYSFVLSDALYKQYYLFKEHQDYDKDIILHLLKFRCGEFLTNTRQLDDLGIGDGVSKSLYNSLKYARLTKQTLEELAGKTDYKLILCDDRTDYPYVNIMSDQISSHITGCFYRNIQRDKAIMHIRALCRDAKKICLYDQYLDDCKDVLKLILPNKKIELIYHPKHLDVNAISDLQKYNPQWTFTSNDSLLTHHDRYIVIDNKMEIILSSGFKYLDSISKELTYVIRPVQENRLEWLKKNAE